MLSVLSADQGLQINFHLGEGKLTETVNGSLRFYDGVFSNQKTEQANFLEDDETKVWGLKAITCQKW